MKCLLAAINSKYIHSNPAVYLLKDCAERRKIPGVTVELAEYTINHHAAEIFNDIYLRHADVVCFSCYLWNMEYVRTLVRNLKQLCPQMQIWLGGPEVSYDCEACLRELPQVDGILYGEGERSFPELLEVLTKRLPNTVDGMPDGCAWIDSQGVFRQTKPQEPVLMDEIPFIYQDADGTSRMKQFQNRILYYETSRGCPFSCSYCLSSIDKKLRFRSMDLVKRELSFFLENHVRQVKFVDRTFNCKKSHAMEIWRFLRDHDNGVTNFHFEIAADLLDEEEIRLLGTMRPGLVQLEIGVQTANPDTIAAINRRMNLERVARVTEEIRKVHNIHQHLDLIAGLPMENYESFGRSFDVVYRMKPSQLQLGFLKVLKGSPMQRQAEQYGILFQTEPPYEVLQTPWLSYEDVIRLKGVEEMVELYYNSGQFIGTVPVMLQSFERPFELFEALADSYRRRGMQEKKYSREAQYQFLLEFGAEQGWTEEHMLVLRQAMTLDYYRREYAKKRPAFALSMEPYKEELRAACRNRFPDRSYKEILQDYHPEVFVPPFTEKPEIWLFDYRHRDPLDQNASIIKINGQYIGRMPDQV